MKIPKVKDLMAQLPVVAGVSAGVVGSQMADKHIPIADPKIKAAVFLLVGTGLVAQKGKKAELLKGVGAGLIAGAANTLAKQFGITGTSYGPGVLLGVPEYHQEVSNNANRSTPMLGVDEPDSKF